MTAALVLAWKFDGGASSVVDFVADGEMSVFVREVAAAIDVVDGGASLWRSVAGDWEREYLKVRQELRDAHQIIGIEPVGVFS